MSKFYSSFSLPLALLLHRGIWTLQTRWRPAGLRRWPAIFRRRTETRCFCTRKDLPFRAGNDLQTGMHYHRVPECLLLHRQFRRGQGKNAVYLYFSFIFVEFNELYEILNFYLNLVSILAMLCTIH